MDVLEGELVAGEEGEIAGRVWAQSMDVGSPSRIAAGDVVVVGDRPEAQRLAIERGVALLVTSNGTVPSEEIVGAGAGARDGGRVVPAGHVRLGADDHAGRSVSRADGSRAL